MIPNSSNQNKIDYFNDKTRKILSYFLITEHLILFGTSNKQTSINKWHLEALDRQRTL